MTDAPISDGSARPGQWKEKANQAGNIIFAAPETVNGTLTQGLAGFPEPHMDQLMEENSLSDAVLYPKVARW